MKLIFYILILLITISIISYIIKYYMNIEHMKNLENKIDANTPVYYINLDDAIERKKNITQLLKRLGFDNVQRVSAVKVKSLEDAQKYKNLIDPKEYQTLLLNNKNKSRKYHHELTNGAIGCFLSHVNIYKEIVKNNIPYALVVEDDLLLKDSKYDFWKKLKNVNIPEDTDLFLFDAAIRDNNLKKGINKINFFYLTTFYLVTNKGATNILKNIFPIKFQVDSQLSSLSFKNKIKIYAIKDNIFSILNAPMGTQIQNLNCNDCPNNNDKLIELIS